MGRKKISIAPIQDERSRSVTFIKRKHGLYKKAYELSVLTECDISVSIIDKKGRLYIFSSTDFHEMLEQSKKLEIHEAKSPSDFYDGEANMDTTPQPVDESYHSQMTANGTRRQQTQPSKPYETYNSPPYTNIQQQPAHVQPPVITHSASQAPNPNRQQQYLPSPSNAGPSNSGSWMIDSSMEYVPAVSGSSSPSVSGLPRQSMPSISYGHAEQAMADHLLHSGHPSHNPGVVSSVPRAGVPVMSSYSMEYFDNDTVPPMNFAYPSHGMPSQSVISSVVPPVNTHSLPPPYKLSIPDGNSPYASPVSATGPNFPNVPFPQQRIPNDSFGRPNPMQQGKNSQYPKSRDFPVESPTSWRRTWDMQWNFP